MISDDLGAVEYLDAFGTQTDVEFAARISFRD